MPVVKPDQKPTPIRTHRVVIVGDGDCGKSSLPNELTRCMLPPQHPSRINRNSRRTFKLVGGAKLYLRYSAAIRQGVEARHPAAKSYRGAHVALVCFSVHRPSLFENVAKKWAVEVRNNCPGIPIFLIGCKIDLREDSQTITDLLRYDQRGPITTAEGERMAKTITAEKYFECSVLAMEGVYEILVATAEAALKGRPQTLIPPSSRCAKCTIL